MEEFLGQLGIQLKAPGKDQKEKRILGNLSISALIEETLVLGKGKLSKDGALVVTTGKHTGRAAKDKYVVMTPETKENLWWSKDVREMSASIFSQLKDCVINHFNQAKQLYYTERSVGADAKHNLGVRVISTGPSYILFANHMFREKIREWSKEDFTILHAPELTIDPEKYDTRSETVIVTHFEEKLVLIMGTHYAGEIKKSVFSIMNYLLPDKGILPMHSGASMGNKNDVSVFFGLSGTGKTTLSTDEGKLLIGDDEHGLSEKGIFNFEGGCYAKTYKLSAETEPGIFKAVTRFGALLENVVLDPQTRQVDFFDKSLAENTRGSYPLAFIEDSIPSSQGPVPQHMFFLSADAFGVLPAVSKLTRNQAMYYFLSGYTAKVAGTEMGVVEPVAAFSPCFGGPFMMRKPLDYGKLLGDLLDKLQTQVWLINTGWFGGGYGVGARFPLQVTRTIIRLIQDQKLNHVPLVTDGIFGLQIPQEIPGVDSTLINPMKNWKQKDSYYEAAKKLALMFHKNMENFHPLSSSILEGGPLFKG